MILNRFFPFYTCCVSLSILFVKKVPFQIHELQNLHYKWLSTFQFSELKRIYAATSQFQIASTECRWLAIRLELAIADRNLIGSDKYEVPIWKLSEWICHCHGLYIGVRHASNSQCVYVGVHQISVSRCKLQSSAVGRHTQRKQFGNCELVVFVRFVWWVAIVAQLLL